MDHYLNNKVDDVVLHRLKAEQMEAVFERKKRLLPRPTDLSFYNWDTQMATSNPTSNFQVTLRTATNV